MKMSLAQRVLLTWLFTLLFLIVLVLKLDETLLWNWFLVFIPLWIFDAVLLVLLTVKLVGRCKAGHERHVRRKVCYLCAVLLKLAFLLALCARLEHYAAAAAAKLSCILAPLWLLLLGAIGDLGYSTFSARTE
uniref:transmembrane protein 60-like n=1 Tax=Pristiophorus japonicus TaxID=55135 RepID=UPI00398E4B29